MKEEAQGRLGSNGRQALGGGGKQAEGGFNLSRSVGGLNGERLHSSRDLG